MGTIGKGPDSLRLRSGDRSGRKHCGSITLVNAVRLPLSWMVHTLLITWHKFGVEIHVSTVYELAIRFSTDSFNCSGAFLDGGSTGMA
jgi:hypothetical protein